MWPIGEISALALIFLALVPRVKPLAWLGAGFNLAFGALMTAFVFGADTYVNDGRSRWATRGGGDHVFYLVTLALVAASGTAFAVVAARGTQRSAVRPALVLSGALDAVFGFMLGVAFASN